MINLLPDNDRKKIFRCYSLRRAAYVLFLVGGAFLLTAILLYPLHLAIRAETIYEKSLFAATPGETKTDSMLIAQEINREVSLLSRKNNKIYPTPYDMLKFIVAKRGTVRIDSLNYRAQTGTLSIRGESPDRATLIAFMKSLEDSGKIMNIDLPVSTFLPERNSGFTMGMSFRQQ